MLETAADRREFFSTDDFAVDCIVLGPAGYAKTIAVIFNPISDPVTIYDSNIEAPNVSFICLAADLADLPRRQIRGCTATINGVAYEFQGISDDQDGYLLTVNLKK
jgi:hypothetical protein